MAKTIYEEFSRERITLMREVNRHPQLAHDIAAQFKVNDRADWGGIVGEIAAYVLVYMEGDYMPSELDKLYVELFFKLQHKRNRGLAPLMLAPTTKF